MTTSVVVRCILFTAEQLFRVKQLFVWSSTDLINYRWFEVNEDGSRYMLSLSGFREECCKRLILVLGLINVHSIRFDATFQTVQLPARTTDLTTCLSDVN